MTKFCLLVDIQDLITCATFGDDRLRGLGVAMGRISHFPIDLRRRPYNALALLYGCVIHWCHSDCCNTRLSTVGDCAFPVAVAHVWNTLPAEVTCSPLLPTFKRRLKTALFAQSYPNSNPDASDTLFTVTCAARTSFQFLSFSLFVRCPSSHRHCTTLISSFYK